jgi:hypothetical protein
VLYAVWHEASGCYQLLFLPNNCHLSFFVNCLGLLLLPRECLLKAEDRTLQVSKRPTVAKTRRVRISLAYRPSFGHWLDLATTHPLYFYLPLHATIVAESIHSLRLFFAAL